MKPYFAFQWHITDTCDQRCKHCYIFAEDNCKILTEMSWDNMEKVIRSCEDMCDKLGRTPYFYITGGDPILHKDFWKLAKKLKDNTIRWAILGNPFHLNDKICQKLHDYGCVKYQLSLDGMEQIHDSFRKSGSFKTTIEKIACIKNAKMFCAIMATVSSANISDFPELIDLCAEKEVDVFAFGRYCPTSGQKSEEYHIEPEEYHNFLDMCYHKFQEHKKNGCKTTFQYKDHLWTLYLYEQGLFKIPENHHPDMIYDGCHCGIGHMTILPTGDVYACRRMESKIGNVFEKSMYDLFVGADLEEYRQFDKFEKCSKCELRGYCRGCPAVTYGYTGDMYKADPQCWKNN
ncbi:MAG: radical SAM/SPASM domain protein, ACGX system [Oscillospiraceae bacterium]|nr:radical SAM/SPASM domain protein, ACGX system [Oscillospiraceae bacterium]